MLRDIHPLEARERAHANIVELREQKRVDEMAAIDLELWIIDGFLGDLQTRWARAKKSAASPPIQFHFHFARPRHQIGQIKPEKIVSFDYVWIAFLNNCRELFERVMFGFLPLYGIDHDELFPAAVIGQGDAGDWILRCLSQIVFTRR